MNYALFDDSGKFLAGRVMSEADTSIQVELDSGKRVKVKSSHVLLRFDKPQPAELIAQGQALAGEIDLDLAWEFASEGEFGFADLARDYFDASAGPVQQAAALFRLFDAPHYFRRMAKGVFRKAPEETVKAALLGIERKRLQALQIQEWAGELAAGRTPQPIRDQLYKILFRPDKNAPEETVKAALLGIERKRLQALQIQDWAAELVAGQTPQPIRDQLYKILFRPDKNAAEYKAVVEASRRAQRSPLDLLKAAGAISSPYQFHWRRFLFEELTKGTGFPPLEAPPIKDELPRADVAAFSIDDSQTTEIDDALSVRGLGTGTVIFGVHIAAPGLAILPDSAIDKVARDRLSTVYMPGWKITMLPDGIVEKYTLAEGRDCPALSLYVTFDEATLEVKSSETRLESVPIAANLRHDKLDAFVTEDSLTGAAPADYPFATELAFTFRLARHLKALREVVRGKPENFNRPDYNFRLETADGNPPTSEPKGDEKVAISERRRGAPLDLIVSEAMILANSTWGGWIAEMGVPGIYRSQASLAPGVKVRMGVRPAPHAGMGVAQYTWATSPLRRYVDLVNQWQIISCVRNGRMAPLSAPFKPKDATLFSIISSFDTAYAAYNGFQTGIERFWTLRWLQQNDVTELDAAVLKDGLVRADTLPLVFKAAGCDGLARGARVRVRVDGVDLLTLDLHARLLAKLDDEPAQADAAAEAADDVDEAEDIGSGPLTLAIDVDEETPPAEGAATPA